MPDTPKPAPRPRPKPKPGPDKPVLIPSKPGKPGGGNRGAR
jgi:hypothetical protein